MCLGVPGQVVAGPDDRGVAIVSVAGRRREISCLLLEDGAVAAGEWVLVHMGFATERLAAAEAHELRALLDRSAPPPDADGGAA
jgi:hydrogenase expression/formation protein HypC